MSNINRRKNTSEMSNKELVEYLKYQFHRRNFLEENAKEIYLEACINEGLRILDLMKLGLLMWEDWKWRKMDEDEI